MTLLGAVGRVIKLPKEGELELVAYISAQLFFGKEPPEARMPDTGV